MNQHITKTAVNPKTYRTPSLFYRSAREGMQDFLSQPQVLPSPEAGILLPAFIGWSPREGSGVYDPVRHLNLRAGFYDLNPDLTVNIEYLTAAIEQHRPRVLVVIHYYGRTEPQMQAVQTLAQQHGILLVEDLAHGFFSAHIGGRAGRFGAVNLYSLHKMFPTPKAEGGMLSYRDTTLLTQQKETAPELARLVMDYDWAGIAQSRRRNFQTITDQLKKLPGRGKDFELLWPDLALDDVPQTLPIRVLTGGRDHIYSTMNAEGYGMVSLYHTLIEPVQAFTDMVALSKSITNFPVHQDVDAEKLSGLVNAFQHALDTRP